MRFRWPVVLLLLVSAFVRPAPLRAERNPLRDVFFGETHVHTSWSLDAFAFGNRVAGPHEAYRYARGERVPHPGGFEVQITQPLDFIGVTEHAEFLVTSIDGRTPPLAEIGNPLHGSEFDVVVYRVGERYYGARSNEFGFASYELERVEK